MLSFTSEHDKNEPDEFYKHYKLFNKISFFWRKLLVSHDNNIILVSFLNELASIQSIIHSKELTESFLIELILYSQGIFNKISKDLKKKIIKFVF